MMKKVLSLAFASLMVMSLAACGSSGGTTSTPAESTPALESMSKGELLGTVLNDGENQGKASINIAAVAADGQEVTSETIGYEVTDGKYVWIPYVKVTVDNYQDFM